MIKSFLIRSGIALLFSVVFALIVYNRDSTETSDNLDGMQRYTCYLPPYLLPLALVIITVMGYLLDADALGHYLALFFGLFLHTSIYFAVLILFLPFFRQRYSARACAMLWLLPNYLYLTMLATTAMPSPLVIIPIPEIVIRYGIGIWLIGFFGVLGWKLLSHLVFRFKVLRNAQPITEPSILALWQQELEEAGMQKKKYRLVRSPAVQTPLSIGLFQRGIRVVLPERYYASEELTLILRHELVHIGREDTGTKFFLVLCTAMCWFNPLMWIAMRRSADDLELSCDETVLLEADDTTRRQYADLLLRTAGDERGFTTCLSANAQAMRYRLKNVVSPRKRRAGGIAVGVVFFLLMMSCGYVALAYNEASGQELLFAGQDPSQFSIESVSLHDSDDWYLKDYLCTDPEVLNEYLAGLRLCKITGNYLYDSNEGVSIRHSGPDGEQYISMDGNAVFITLYREERIENWYYCPDGLDWELLHSLIVPRPRMDVTFPKDNPSAPDTFTMVLNSYGHTLHITSGGVTEEVGTPSKDGGAWLQRGEPPAGERVTLSFTHKLYDGTFEILVENWDRTSSYTLSSDDLPEPFSFDLEPDYAHYTVRTTIVGDDDALHDMEFRFHIGPFE